MLAVYSILRRCILSDAWAFWRIDVFSLERHGTPIHNVLQLLSVEEVDLLMNLVICIILFQSIV